MDGPLGLVIGNGFTKTWSARRKKIFSSRIATEQAGVDFSGFQSADDFVIEYGGERFAIGDTTERLSDIVIAQMDRSRIGSDFYKVLMAAALVATCGTDEGEIYPVVTLPLDWYEGREQFKKDISGNYEVSYKNKQYTYHIDKKNIRVVVEGFGVLAEQLLDEEGCIKTRGLANATIGVIEIGTGTVDISMFKNLQIVPVKSNGLETGLNKVWRAIAKDIKKDYKRELQLHEVDAAIRGGYFMNSGQRVLMKDYTEKHMPGLAKAIISEVNQLWDQGREADRIYIAGGGAPQLIQYFDYPHQEKVDKAWLADAHGVYLYGLFRMKQEQ